MLPHLTEPLVPLAFGHGLGQVEEEFQPPALEETAGEDPVRSAERDARLCHDHLRGACGLDERDVTVPDRAFGRGHRADMYVEGDSFGRHERTVVDDAPAVTLPNLAQSGNPADGPR